MLKAERVADLPVFTYIKSAYVAAKISGRYMGARGRAVSCPSAHEFNITVNYKPRFF